MPEDKRLRYFRNQFLTAQDFTDEQEYLIDRQERHNRLFHTRGIASGLEVVPILENTQVEVSPGNAVDGNGKQIVLTAKQTVSVNLPDFFNKSVLIVISYAQQPFDIAETGGKDFTRWKEVPNIQAFVEANAPPDTTHIRLAKLTINASGKINLPVDLSLRLTAGVRLGDTTFNKVTLSSQNVANPSQYPVLSSDAANQVNLQGNLVVSGEIRNNTTGNVAVGGKLNVQTTSSGLTGTPGAAFVWNGSGAGSCGLVAKMTTTPTSAPNPPSAAVAGVANIDDVYGIYATAKDGTFALKVDGTAQIKITDATKTALFVDGLISASGAKTGYVVDTFINASGQRLRTGDVVKLKGSTIARFKGLNNSIPIPEVTLCDRENDSTIIGIVSQEAVPDPDSPDTRVDAKDPTFIENGGELYVVTLGTFAHCKADATEAPIAVGDLLTASKNPGHAKKATNPQIGSIIGKALEPLPAGQGYIAVFVNIQ